jgi:hypothetical protein
MRQLELPEIEVVSGGETRLQTVVVVGTRSDRDPFLIQMQLDSLSDDLFVPAHGTHIDLGGLTNDQLQDLAEAAPEVIVEDGHLMCENGSDTWAALLGLYGVAGSVSIAPLSGGASLIIGGIAGAGAFILDQVVPDHSHCQGGAAGV